MMPRTSHSKAQYHKEHFLCPQVAETCDKIVGRDFKPGAGMRVKLSDAGKEYIELFDSQHGTKYYDEGVGTIVGTGREVYIGMCDVRWDSGNAPTIDNTYHVYNTGNDGLYHLALAEDPPYSVQKVEPRGMTKKDQERLANLLRNEQHQAKS